MLELLDSWRKRLKKFHFLRNDLHQDKDKRREYQVKFEELKKCIEELQDAMEKTIFIEDAEVVE